MQIHGFLVFTTTYNLLLLICTEKERLALLVRLCIGLRESVLICGSATHSLCSL